MDFEGNRCDNRSHGAWRYKNRKAEIWGAKYRIGQYPHSLGQFDTQLEAMIAYDKAVRGLDNSWRYDRYFTKWGWAEVASRPELLLEVMLKHDRSKRLRDILRRTTYERPGDRYLTEWGYLHIVGEDEEQAAEECLWAGPNQPTRFCELPDPYEAAIEAAIEALE